MRVVVVVTTAAVVFVFVSGTVVVAGVMHAQIDKEGSEEQKTEDGDYIWTMSAVVDDEFME